MEELIIAVLTPIIGAAVIAVRAWLQARITPDRLAAVSQLARVAVDAAEEIGRAADGIKPGEKFEYAEGFLKQSARRVGVKLSNEEANAFIHAVLTGQRNTIEDAVNSIINDLIDGTGEYAVDEVATEAG